MFLNGTLGKPKFTGNLPLGIPVYFLQHKDAPSLYRQLSHSLTEMAKLLA